jgi:hypothetical protein
MSETYITTVEVLQNDHYSIFAECEITYSEIENAETHPYGDGVATQYYSEIEVEDVDILCWYREFDCDQEMEQWIPEHMNFYSGSDGLDYETKQKIIRTAESSIDSSILL